MATESRSLLQRFDEPSIPLAFAARLLLGYVFIMMGVHKIGDPFAFLKLIHQYQILPVNPGHYMNITALMLPWLEVVCGVALILGMWLRGAALTQTLLLAVFTPVVFLRAWSIHTTESTPFFQVAFDCGCGSGVVIIWKKLLENLGLFTLAVLLTLSRSRKFTLASLLDRFGFGVRKCPKCGAELTGSPGEICQWCRPAYKRAAAKTAEAVA